MPPFTAVTIRANEELAQQLAFISWLWRKPVEEVALLLLSGTVIEALEDNEILTEAYDAWACEQLQQTPPLEWSYPGR